MSDHAAIEKLADQVLLVLRKNPSRGYTPLALSRKLKAKNEHIIRAILKIEEWGYRLNTSRGNLISFLSAPDMLSATEIGYGLKTKVIGQHIFAFRSVQSTNDIATRMAEAGILHGSVVTADEQTQGRGRLGRSWHSPPETGIYLSIILRPTFPPDKAPGVSLTTALALADTLAEYCPGEVQIKWPNDVLIKGKKVAGILTELSAERTAISSLIVGVGINVNQQSTDFPSDIRALATSLRRATRKKQARVKVLQNFLVRFEKEYAKFESSYLDKVRSRLRHYSSLLGKEITLLSGSEEINGRVVDIDEAGRLVLKQDGKKIVLNSGEVTIVKS